MKMERLTAAIIYVLLTFALVDEMSITAQARETGKRRTKEKTGSFLKNICDVTDRDSKVHCYCENNRELRNATKAECWVFKGGIQQDDILWQSFASQPALQSLSFNVRVDGALGYVPTKALNYLQKIRFINIKYGDIGEITSLAIANFTDLKEVTLSTNQIENLQQHAFAHLPNITTIHLDDNTILEIGSEVFYDLPNLQKLVLAKNNISSIKDGAFQHTFNLLELDLNKNNICHLNRHTFDGLANLRKLDLRRNRIHNLTEFTFAELWNLHELLLGQNDLKYISERAFDGLSQLDKLTLDDNKLIVLPSGWLEGARGLSSLDLRSNELYAFTFENIKPIYDNLKPQNSNLLLEGNNFLCHCKLRWMHSLRNETRSQNTKESLDSVTCKMDSPVSSSAYNKIPDSIQNKPDYNQEILHAGLTIETNLSKLNYTEHTDGHDQRLLSTATSKQELKRNFLKIPPDTLPCLSEINKITETPQPANDPVIPVQKEVKTYRHRDINSGPSLTVNILIIRCAVLSFFFT